MKKQDLLQISELDKNSISKVLGECGPGEMQDCLDFLAFVNEFQGLYQVGKGDNEQGFKIKKYNKFPGGNVPFLKATLVPSKENFHLLIKEEDFTRMAGVEYVKGLFPTYKYFLNFQI